MSQQDRKKKIAADLTTAANQGQITSGSQSIVISNLEQTVLPATFGASPMSFGTTAPSLVMFVRDISGSVAGQKNIDIAAAQEGTRQILVNEVQRTGLEVLVAETVFNNVVRTARPFENISQTKPFAPSDYFPDDLTNLYGAIHQALTDLIIYGADVYTSGSTGYQQFLVIISDGQPQGSQSKTLEEVRDFIREFSSKPNAVVVFIGVGEKSVFQTMAANLGIVNIRVYDPGNPNWAQDMALDISSGVSRHSQQAAAGQPVSGDDFFIVT